MTEESKQTPAEQEPASKMIPDAEVKAASRIPMTSVAVMIFILLVAFACTGVSVVVDMVNQKNAPAEIKGKDDLQQVEYPLLANLPDGVAAKVNDVEIPESQVTERIMTMRSRLGLEDQQAWDDWMISTSNSTETLRNRIIMFYVNNEIIDQMAAQMGIEPTEEDVAAYREELFADPEQKQEIEQMLAEEGRTMEEYEETLTTLTKRKLIGEAAVEELMQLPEFSDGVLTVIKERNPEYANATSLDEIDDVALVESVTQEVADLNESKSFSERAHEFLKNSGIFYSKIGSDMPYQSNSDVYFMKKEIKQMLNKNGLFIGEGGLLESLEQKANEGNAE